VQMSTTVAIHMTAVLSATALGPFVIWTRLGKLQRPHVHRVLGYAWTAFMTTGAVSALFIRDFNFPNVAGYTFIHLLIPATGVGLYFAFRYLSRGNILGHRRCMIATYVGACLIAGVFTFLPNRYLGKFYLPAASSRPGDCFDLSIRTEATKLALLWLNRFSNQSPVSEATF
jgi:uncharacterized membrane protein